MAVDFLRAVDVTAMLHAGAPTPAPSFTATGRRYYRIPGDPPGYAFWAANARPPEGWVRISKHEYDQATHPGTAVPLQGAPGQRDVRPGPRSSSPARRVPAERVPRDRRAGRTPRAPRPPRAPRAPRAPRSPRTPRARRSPRASRKPRAPRPPRAPRTPRAARSPRTKPCPYRRTVCTFFKTEDGGLVLESAGGQTIACNGKPEIPPMPGAIIVPTDNPAACANLACNSKVARWVQKAMQAIIGGWRPLRVAAAELVGGAPPPAGAPGDEGVAAAGAATAGPPPPPGWPEVGWARLTPFRGTAAQLYGTQLVAVRYPYDPGPLTGTNSQDWMLLGPYQAGQPYDLILG